MERKKRVAKKFAIKDSGERREFDTGANRDVDDGKPRFDLIPLTVLRQMFLHPLKLENLEVDDENEYDLKVRIMQIGFDWGETLDYNQLYQLMWICLRLIQYSENEDTLLDVDPDGYDGFTLISIGAYNRLAQLYGNGAKKYDPWNWTKGMPISVFHASLMRHIFKCLADEKDEDHLSAIFFNAAALVHFHILGRSDLDDITPRLVDWNNNRVDKLEVDLEKLGLLEPTNVLDTDEIIGQMKDDIA